MFVDRPFWRSLRSVDFIRENSYEVLALALPKEITSTEKLLDLIKQKSPYPAGTGPSTESNPPTTHKPTLKIFSSTKKIVVGVDIGHEFIRMVKAARLADRAWKLIDTKSVAIPSNLSKESQEFINLLKTRFNEFAGQEDSEAWGIMSAADVDIRHIRIPKLPKKQITRAVYLTAKKENPFDEKEVFFDFEVQGEVIDQGIPRLSVMTYTAPRATVDQVKNLFSRAGITLEGITIVPFAMQNLFRQQWIPASDATVAMLFIGNNFSRIDVFSGGNLVMTRGIKAGMNSMAEDLVLSFEERVRSSGSNTQSMSLDDARSLLFSGGKNSSLGEDEIFAMILPAVERLIRQLERTIDYYHDNYPADRIQKMYVSGVMNIYDHLVSYICEQLGIAKESMDFLGGAAVTIVRDRPELSAISDRVAFVPALGAALSDNSYTPNVIFTYQDKEKAAAITRINWGIIIAFIAAMVICTGIFIYQGYAAYQKDKTITALGRELHGYNPQITKDLLEKTYSKFQKQKKALQSYEERYRSVAYISEIADITPGNIKLIGFKNYMEKSSASTDKTKSISVENMELEGIVTGDRNTLESDLAQYSLKLEASPIFKQVTTKKSEISSNQKRDALYFSIAMKRE